MDNPSSRLEWRPTATIENLRLRGRVLASIRAFFAERGVLEVETPVLSTATATDPHLDSLVTRYTGPGAAAGLTLYLQTSPEFAMKRLLAAGSGPIYQLGKAFRNGEAGRRHNPEFTLLEWYRPGFDLRALMDEVEALIASLLGTPAAERLSYAEAFIRHAGIDPHAATAVELKRLAALKKLGESLDLSDEDKDGWLDLLLTHLVEPHLGKERPVFIFDYPPSQAALARIRPGNPSVAERFELYIDGIELANGYHELGDAREQRCRFEADRERRRIAGLPGTPIDERLLAALEHGLPDCSGVALGIDRLVMIAAQAQTLNEAMAFPLLCV